METSSLTETLLEFNKHITPKDLFVTLIPEAQDLVLKDPYAFLIASVLDRGTKAEVIWTIPYCLRLQMGHLDASKINQMTEEELGEVFNNLPNKPRYINDAPRTIKELTALIINDFNGKANLLWEGHGAIFVNKVIDDIYGVGQGIANMTVLLIERAFNVHFDDLDRKRMDIKPDIHTKRVLYRLGVSKKEDNPSALEAARELNPHFPGEIDAPLWIIGRRFCHPSEPHCEICPVIEYCERRTNG